MAVTIFHKVINNKIKIVNKKPKDEVDTTLKVNGKVQLNRHSIKETKVYD